MTNDRLVDRHCGAQTSEERDAAIDRKAVILAIWKDRAEGISWLEALTEAGEAARLPGNGYPNYYTARAADVLPLIDQVRPTHRHL